MSSPAFAQQPSPGLPCPRSDPPDHPSFPSIGVSHGVLRCPDDAVGALDLLSVTRQCRALTVGRMQSRAGYVRTTDLFTLPLSDFETSRREHS